MWAIALAYLFQDLLFMCLKCYGPNVVLLHSSVSELLYYLTVWGFNWCIRNALHCITYILHHICTNKRLSIVDVEPQKSAHCKFRMHLIWVTKYLVPLTVGDHWRWCRHCLPFRMPLPLSLNPFCSLHLQWGCNDHMGFWIRDGSRQTFKPAKSIGSASNAGCGSGSNTTWWVSLWGHTKCWCAMTAPIWNDGWSMY